MYFRFKGKGKNIKKIQNHRKVHYTVGFTMCFRSFKLRWQYEPHSKRLKAVNFNPKNRPRRQDWPGEIIETGMFYFARRKLIEIDGILQNEWFEIGKMTFFSRKSDRNYLFLFSTFRCEFVEIDDQHVLEIDHPHQLTLANILVND